MLPKNYTTQKVNYSNSWGWICFIILLSVWLVFGMNDSNGLSTGDWVGIIGGILGILAFGWQLFKGSNDYFRGIRPYKITFSTKKREQIYNDSDMLKQIQLPIGENILLMRIKLLRSSNLTMIKIRPVQGIRRNNFSDGKQPLTIQSIQKVDVEESGFDVAPDNVGGINIHHQSEYSRVQGTNIHYYLHVNANKKWKGKMLFSAEVNNKRTFSYGNIEII